MTKPRGAPGQLFCAVGNRFEQRAMVGVASEGLAIFRMLFGGLMFIGLLRFLWQGWVDVLFVEPKIFFKFLGFSWVPVWPRWGMYMHYVALLGLALAICIGFRTRLASLLFLVGFGLVQLMDVTNYLNHYVLVLWLSFWLSLSPAGSRLSVDAWLQTKAASIQAKPPPHPLIPMYWYDIFRFQLAVVYVFAAVAKVSSDWLLYGQPMGIWLSTRTHLPILGPVLGLPSMPLWMSWAGFLYDATIVLWLSWKKTRLWAYLTVLLFHGMTSALFDIGMFPGIMVVSTTVFFAPDWPNTFRRFIAARSSMQKQFGAKRASASIFDDVDVQPHCPSSSMAEDAPSSEMHATSDLHLETYSRSSTFRAVPQAASNDGLSREAPATRATATLPRTRVFSFLLIATFQIVFPLRAFAYPGNVLWSEQGMRFSWRVMVREKSGSITYHVHSPSRKRTWQTSPHDYLTWRQANEMSGQPDLILQMAHIIAADFRARGVTDVEVRAETWVSLNGRPPQALIDPERDLALEVDDLSPATWILSPPTTPPLPSGVAQR